ncbi:MAG: YqaA family protein [Armatimonadota bacterium]|nr:DedA family protein [Armatimonadota bacterium]MCX7777110.1 DedA family protein [Armatimonadota bacterium]MDW8025157.1 YqaA family protein [Armatimonadota bacterium]
MEALQQWALQMLDRYGMLGLFTIAFIESSFFPIPPDVLLIAITTRTPNAAFCASIICTVGSVLGALLGYAIGFIGGRPLLLRLFSRSKVEAAESLYHEYGAWAVLIAAFTPIPYKVFTIASGVFKLNVLSMLLMSVIGRGARFFLVAYSVRLVGQAFVKQLDILSLLLVLVLVGFFALVWFYHRRRGISVSKAGFKGDAGEKCFNSPNGLRDG